MPLIEASERELQRLAGGETGRLHIAIECHACFEWLMPVLDTFRGQWPEVEVDICLGVAFDPIPALQKGDVDLVITSDVLDLPHLAFEPLFDFEALLVMAPSYPLATKQFIEPSDLHDQTLITYPVDRQRLDVFKCFLQPAGLEPRFLRRVELTAVILMLVASLRGVAALPDWVLREATLKSRLVTRQLGEHGLTGTLYAAVRKADSQHRYIIDFVTLARQCEIRDGGFVSNSS